MYWELGWNTRDKYEFDVFNIVVTQNIPPGRIKMSTMLRISSVLVSPTPQFWNYIEH